ncbi:MAG: ABC transporter ATP-binding protein [Bacteroidales bacterium]|jgi:lipoprotein-releasing system ATP-binding protein|nr:ABC transporter ATP-binding protein [Bacteroidales bacterium]
MIVELHKISKFYENAGVLSNRNVLNEISLSIKSGDALSIIGPSGSGKSTLLNIIGTLDLPTSGIVKIKGKEVQHFNENQLADIRNTNIGFIFQQHHLLPQFTLIENVLVPTIPLKDKNLKKNALDRAMSLLESVGLSDKIHQRPGQMSGGECQRATVVRALINEPNLVLADEPTGSLDQDAAEQMGSLLSEINKKHNVAMVVVTHSLDLAKNMDTMYNLDHGRLEILGE